MTDSQVRISHQGKSRIKSLIPILLLSILRTALHAGAIQALDLSLQDTPMTWNMTHMFGLDPMLVHV